MTGDLPPSGCRYCGLPERGHFQRWHESVHWHVWMPPLQHQIKERMVQRRADRIAAPEPTGDLRERLAEALNEWTLEAAGASRVSPPVHPRTLENLRLNSLARADAVLPVVEAETAALRAALDRAHEMAAEYSRRGIENGERAEEAERQRDEALAAVQRVRDLHQPTKGMGFDCDEDDTPGSYGDIAEVCTSCGTADEYGVRWPCPTIAALDQPEGT